MTQSAKAIRSDFFFHPLSRSSTSCLPHRQRLNRGTASMLGSKCCKGAVQAMELGALARLASVAERVQIAEVQIECAGGGRAQ